MSRKHSRITRQRLGASGPLLRTRTGLDRAILWVWASNRHTFNMLLNRLYRLSVGIVGNNEVISLEKKNRHFIPTLALADYGDGALLALEIAGEMSTIEYLRTYQNPALVAVETVLRILPAITGTGAGDKVKRRDTRYADNRTALEETLFSYVQELRAGQPVMQFGEYIPIEKGKSKFIRKPEKPLNVKLRRRLNMPKMPVACAEKLGLLPTPIEISREVLRLGKLAEKAFLIQGNLCELVQKYLDEAIAIYKAVCNLPTEITQPHPQESPHQTLHFHNHNHTLEPEHWPSRRGENACPSR